MYHYYKIHHLTLQSQFPFPELIEVKQQESDIVIIESLVPHSLNSELGIIFEGHLTYEKFENKLLLLIKDVGRVLIEEGKTITFERADGVDDGTLRLYILGSCLSFALMMQGIFPLHGSVVNTDHGTAMFMGESGYGKSTIAATFNAKGHQVLSDDVSIVRFDTNNTPLVFPSVRHIKLWDDSIDKLGYDKKNLSKVMSNWNKWQIGTDKKYNPAPFSLSVIYDLDPRKDKHLCISPIYGIEKLNILLKNIHRPIGIEIFGLEKEYFYYCNKLAQNVPVKRLSRSTEIFDIDGLYDAISVDMACLDS